MKPCSLLSVFLQTDQVWRAMCLSFLSIKFSSERSTFSGLFLNVKYVKKVEKGFLDTAVDY